LLGLVITLQLSAQSPDFLGDYGQQPSIDNAEQMGAPDRSSMTGKAFDKKGKDAHQPPFFQQEERGECPSVLFDQLSEKDKDVVEGYIKELHKAIGQKENELFLKKAELRYLIHIDKPDINQIAGKLDEIGKLESAIQLEKIKFELKVKDQFPTLGENIRKGPRSQRPEAGAPASADRPDKVPTKRK